MSTELGSPFTRRSIIGIALYLRPGAGQMLPSDKPMTRQEMEGFLTRAEVTKIELPPNKSEEWVRVSLKSGEFTHLATFRTTDRQTLDHRSYRDSWMFDLAAYRLDRMLERGMVPATVERTFSGKRGSLVWWVDDVLMDEGRRLSRNVQPPDATRWRAQMNIARVFDELICNMNRNTANLLIDKDWHVWLIDHCRCFRVRKELKNPGNLTPVGQPLLNNLKNLSAALIQREMGEYLLGPEIAALLARRDRIVEVLEGRSSVVCD